MRKLAILFTLLLTGPLSDACPPTREMQSYLPDSARIYNNLGIESFRRGDYEKAGELFIRSLNIKRDQGPLSPDMASTYSNLGVVNRRLNRYEQAMAYYDTAGIIYMEHHGPDHPWLGAVYQNQGNILRDLRDLNSALSYYNSALRIFIVEGASDWIAGLYNNMAIAYQDMQRYHEAEEYFLRSIDIRRSDPAGIAFPAGNLAINYKETGEMLKADRYYRMAVEAIADNWGAENAYYAISLMNYGLFLVDDMNELEKGYRMFSDALEVHRSLYGERGHHLARTLMNIGLYYHRYGDFDTAMEYYQRAIIANTTSFDSYDYADNPHPDEGVYSPDYMLDILKNKAFTFSLLRDRENKREMLEQSLAAYRAAIDFIEKIRMGHQTEESRLLLAESEHETYMQSINVAWQLYELTGDKAFVREAFILSEKSKAASLLASIRDISARAFGGVPAELLEEEQELLGGISAYRELIYEEQRNPMADSAKISLWQGRVFALEMDLRQLVARLEVEYPEYHTLKYNHAVTGIEGVMKDIGRDDAMITYVYNDSLIYIFTVTSRDYELYRITPPVAVGRQLEKLLEVLTSGNLDRRVRDDFVGFASSARTLYETLVAPVMGPVNRKRFVIVPDGILSYVPFELLLTSDPPAGRFDYRDLAYFLNDYTVSYNYSATLWQENLKRRSASGKNILAMAPRYEFSELPPSGPYSSRQSYRDRLVPLPGAREEAIQVANMMNGDVLLDGEATENNFKQLAGGYRILHLAMHTLLDDVNPMYSKLVFSESDNDPEDGFLNTHEIYNIRLNADLAVLSSCRSGYGTLRSGEGIFSLARGFFYAGVPSIIMTNWEIEDKSGASIMVSFYRYLLRGYRKDEALRLARLDFIKDADMLKAHPYFWGAFVSIGNQDEIFRSRRQIFPAVTFGILLLVMVAVLWKVNARTLK